MMKVKCSERKDVLVLSSIVMASFSSIGLLASLDQISDNPYLIASFGATAVLIYGVPDAPFSKPRNVLFGHLLSAIIRGDGILHLRTMWVYGRTEMVGMRHIRLFIHRDDGRDGDHPSSGRGYGIDVRDERIHYVGIRHQAHHVGCRSDDGHRVHHERFAE